MTAPLSDAEWFERAQIQSPRFWRKVEKTSACWLWRGRRDQGGYGQFHVTGDRERGPKQRAWRAHRLAWELAHGAIPSGLLVIHECDNPPCVNVSHLRIGTTDENIADKLAKGRQSRGETHGSRTKPEGVCRGERNKGGGKLKETDIPKIRTCARSGEPLRSIARRFSVSRSTIKGIVVGRLWRCVPDLQEAS